MANPVWPGTLPQYVLESGYSETPQDQTLESPMEYGPAKLRRRYTKILEKMTMSIALTQAQAVTFENFWRTTLLSGTIPFDWVHPRTRATTTFRFRNPSPQTSVTNGSVVIKSFTLETV